MMKNKEAQYFLKKIKILNSIEIFSFSMAIYKAKEKLLKEKKVLDSIKEPSREFEIFQKEINTLNEKYILEDEKGNPIIVPVIMPNGEKLSQYQLDNCKERKEKIKFIVKKYQKIKEEQEEKEKKYEKAMNEDTLFKPVFYDFNLIEKEKINIEMQEVLNFLLINKKS